MVTDFPHIRSKLVCPICLREKDNGAITCWPCYRVTDGRNGYACAIRSRLDGLEAYLALCDEAQVRRDQIGRISFKSAGATRKR